MISLSEFINQNNGGVRLIEWDCTNEDLKDLNPGFHGSTRMSSVKTLRSQNDNGKNQGDIKEEVIREMFAKANTYFEDACSRGEVDFNKSVFGIVEHFRVDKILVLFVITNFNKSTFEYDVKIVTCERLRDFVKFDIKKPIDFTIIMRGRTKTKKYGEITI